MPLAHLQKRKNSQVLYKYTIIEKHIYPTIYLLIIPEHVSM